MKVLMFGWEFPPHISGGLGTACHGLTRSLRGEDVEVLFVVPKLHGDEPSEKISLISASDIAIKQYPKTSISADTKTSKTSEGKNGVQSPGKVSAPVTSTLASEETSVQLESRSNVYSRQITIRQEENVTHIEVPSSLSPYQSPAHTYGRKTIKHWSYSIDAPEDAEAPATDQDQKQVSKTSAYNHQPGKGPGADTNTDTAAEVQADGNDLLPEDTENTKGPTELRYVFSGSYGPSLLTEVERYAAVAAEIARQFDFDVIHAHDWMTYPAGLAAKEVSGKPLVVHVHATEFDRAGENGDHRVYHIEREGMKGADRVVTVSEWTKNLAIAKYNVPLEKIEVVHNGIIPREENSVSFSSPLASSPIVTFLGRITHQKGPIFFVEAARKVLEHVPEARFIVAGSGDLLPAMIKRVAQLKMSSRFHFTGFLKGKDIDKIWSISNVYVMPSVSEPFGIAPLEAIQAGVPVIISRQSGVAEVMPHAIAVDFWNSSALADAICSVLRYKSLYQTLRKNSGAEIKNITWDKAAKKINHLYHELISHD